eukprot:3669180-Alexandrium_andersonii.AAC.1
MTGLLRITHNLLRSAEAQLAHFNPVWESLKQIELLLKPGRRKALEKAFFSEGPAAKDVKLLRSFSAALYEARWHEVTNFLPDARPILNVLRDCWREQAFTDLVGRGEGASKD